jgi:hypothetical protein
MSIIVAAWGVKISYNQRDSKRLVVIWDFAVVHEIISTFGVFVNI